MMDPGAYPRLGKRLGGPCFVLTVLLLSLGVTLSEQAFKETFITKCKAFKGLTSNCDQVWATFEQAYVGKDPHKVGMENYDPLFTLVPIKTKENSVMLWSKTKAVLDKWTQRSCYMTMGETLLGFVLDGLTWCGKVGSTETITDADKCPKWADEKGPVYSFWSKASAAFADSAEGDVTVLLSGSIPEPYDAKSILATIEVKRLKSPRVKSLKVLLVRDKKEDQKCNNESLKNLQKELDQGIKYSCEEVPISDLVQDKGSQKKPARACAIL